MVEGQEAFVSQGIGNFDAGLEGTLVADVVEEVFFVLEEGGWDGLGDGVGITGQEGVLKCNEVGEEVGAGATVGHEAAGAGAAEVDAGDVEAEGDVLVDGVLGDVGVPLVGDCGDAAVSVGVQDEGGRSVRVPARRLLC